MSESTLIKMPHCWKSRVAAHYYDQGLSGICGTNVNSNCLKLFETLIWAETEWGGDRGSENYKLSFISTKKNWYELPWKSNTPAPVGVVWIRTRMSYGGFFLNFHFLHVAGLAIILSRAN